MQRTSKRWFLIQMDSTLCLLDSLMDDLRTILSVESSQLVVIVKLVQIVFDKKQFVLVDAFPIVPMIITQVQALPQWILPQSSHILSIRFLWTRIGKSGFLTNISKQTKLNTDVVIVCHWHCSNGVTVVATWFWGLSRAWVQLTHLKYDKQSVFHNSQYTQPSLSLQPSRCMKKMSTTNSWRCKIDDGNRFWNVWVTCKIEPNNCWQRTPKTVTCNVAIMIIIKSQYISTALQNPRILRVWHIHFVVGIFLQEKLGVFQNFVIFSPCHWIIFIKGVIKNIFTKATVQPHRVDDFVFLKDGWQIVLLL